MITEHLARVKGNLRSYYSHKLYGQYWTAALGDKTLRQIVPGDIEHYVAKRICDVAPASVNRELAFLKRVFNIAIADGKADTNPVRSVKLFKENNKRVRFLRDEEEPRLREALGAEEWEGDYPARFTRDCVSPSNFTCGGSTSTSTPAYSPSRGRNTVKPGVSR